MRKYLIAATVALAVFAMSAFAASLTVDGGVVQAGTDADLTCADSADVTYSTTTTADGSFAVDGITVDFAAGCNAAFASVAVVDGTGAVIGSGTKVIADDAASFTVDSTHADADVENVVSVSVLVNGTDDSAGTGAFVGIITG